MRIGFVALFFVAVAIVFVSMACAEKTEIVEVTRVAQPSKADVRVYHDTQRNVTCWIVERGGTSAPAVAISCLPDLR